MKISKAEHPLFYRIYFEFAIIGDYIFEMERAIGLAMQLEDERLDEYLDKFPQDGQAIAESFEGTKYHYQNTYRHLLRRSALISTYSLFESMGAILCKFAKEYRKASLGWEDIYAHGDIDAHKKYLTKVIGLDLAHLESIWDEINVYRKVRNLIVHNHSNIIEKPQKPLNKQPLFQMMTHKDSYLFVDHRTGNFAISNNEYVFHLSSIASRYLLDVLKEILKLKKKRKSTKV